MSPENGHSLFMKRLSIYALADFERYRAAAKRATKISDGTEHPLFAKFDSPEANSYQPDFEGSRC
jgi:DNA-directed RNA polymerase subunit K/omega